MNNIQIWWVAKKDFPVSQCYYYPVALWKGGLGWWCRTDGRKLQSCRRL